jgi:hypothetical protein
MASLDIFHSYNPSGRTLALGSTQPLTEMNSWVWVVSAMPQPLYPRELVFFGLTLDSSIRCALSVAVFVRAPVVMCVTLICCSSHVPISSRILRKIKQYNDALLGPCVRCLFRDVCSMDM